MRVSTLSFSLSGICEVCRRKVPVTRIYGRCLGSTSLASETIVTCPVNRGRGTSLDGKIVLRLTSHGSAVYKKEVD